MNKTEALKLALEVATIRWNSPSAERSYADKMVIDATEEALAQPGDSVEQEPVAWMVDAKLCVRADWVDHLNHRGSFVDLGRAIPDAWMPVLYTAPPKREPDDFDSWYASPYAKVLMKSIEEDYQPKRTWVGLTGQEKALIASVSLDVHDAIYRANDKLKELNHG